MKNLVQIHEFHKQVKMKEMVIFQATVFICGDSLARWKLTKMQNFGLVSHKITPARPK